VEQIQEWRGERRRLHVLEDEETSAPSSIRGGSISTSGTAIVLPRVGSDKKERMKKKEGIDGIEVVEEEEVRLHSWFWTISLFFLDL
jgi:hypothetical protein